MNMQVLDFNYSSSINLNAWCVFNVDCLEEEREISMLQETCRFPGCPLFASRFTEPFCWEHVEPERQTAPLGERLEVTRPTEGNHTHMLAYVNVFIHSFRPFL